MYRIFRFTVVFSIVLLISNGVQSQIIDSIQIAGKASPWANYNFNQPLSLHTGIRFIPQLNFEIKQKHTKIDFEVSAHINGAMGIKPFDSLTHSASIKPYRAWLRYSSNQWELRLGLQKINFGSANMLRPLMWFDRLDPRDPMQLTDGVWALLGRYYFLNNANIWLWLVKPSNKPKTWEIFPSNTNFPEAGGRLQWPVKKGEIGFSFHRRVADSRKNQLGVEEFEKVNENRFGLDGKWDVLTGLWFEVSNIRLQKSLGPLTNQTIINVGTDYTFNIGHGLTAIFEQIAFTSSEKPFQYSNSSMFSGLTMTYPLNMLDNLQAIIFYDWHNNNSYNFVHFKRIYSKFEINLMAYWNPENYLMPHQRNTQNMFAGKGVQLMLVYSY